MSQAPLLVTSLLSNSLTVFLNYYLLFLNKEPIKLDEKHTKLNTNTYSNWRFPKEEIVFVIRCFFILHM